MWEKTAAAVRANGPVPKARAVPRRGGAASNIDPEEDQSLRGGAVIAISNSADHVRRRYINRARPLGPAPQFAAGPIMPPRINPAQNANGAGRGGRGAARSQSGSFPALSSQSHTSQDLDDYEQEMLPDKKKLNVAEEIERMGQALGLGIDQASASCEDRV